MKKINFIVTSIITFLVGIVMISANDNTAQPLALQENVTSAIVVDAQTGQILAEKNADKMVQIASQSKMLTAYAVLRGINSGKIKWTDKVPITKKSDLSKQDSHLFSHLAVKAGDTLTVRELYNAMIKLSANDAAFALGEYMTPKSMTMQGALKQWAAELHLTGSKWYNSAGQVNKDAFSHRVKDASDEAANEASAEQLAVLARTLVQLDPNIRTLSEMQYISYKLTPQYTVKEPTDYLVLQKEVLPNLINPNQLVIEGLKTGSTPESGAAFTGLIKDADGHEFITVVNGAGVYTDVLQRYQSTINIVNDVLKHQVPITYTKGNELAGQKTIKLRTMKTHQMPVVMSKSKTFWANNNIKPKTETTLTKVKGKSVKKGDVLGHAHVNLAGAKYLTDATQSNQTIPLVATEQTNRTNWFVRTWRAIFD